MILQSSTPASQLNLLSKPYTVKELEAAPTGHVLIAFRHGLPTKLIPSGKRARRIINTPIFGATLRALDAGPNQYNKTVRGVTTRDNLSLPEIAVTLSVRINTAKPEMILHAIALDGERCTVRAEGLLSESIERTVREQVRATDAVAISDAGIRSLFAVSDFFSPLPLLEVVGIVSIDWTNSSHAQQILDARGDAVSKQQAKRHVYAADDVDFETSMRRAAQEGKVSEIRQLIRHHQEQRDLDQVLARAEQLGIPGAMLAEPELISRALDRQAELVEKLLESPMASSVLRRNPNLLGSVLSQLAGEDAPTQNSRDALRVIDSVSTDLLPTAKASRQIYSGQSNSVDRLLHQDSTIFSAWSSVASPGSLMASGVALSPSRESARAAIIIKPNTNLTSDIIDTIKVRLKSSLALKKEPTVMVARGHGLESAVNAMVNDLSPSVDAQYQVRSDSKGSTDVIVELNGPPEEVKAVHMELCNPEKPRGAVLDSLIAPHYVRFAM